MSLVAGIAFAIAITEPAVSTAPATAASTPITTSVGTPSAVTVPPAPMVTPYEKTPPRWEATVGVQGWGNEGFLSLGYRKRIHEIRLLGNIWFDDGPAAGLDYRTTFFRRGRLKIHGGGLVRYPFRAGGHVGAAYRSGGGPLLGQMEWGIDAGAWCGADRGESDCGPMLGLYGGFYFEDALFGGDYF